MGCANVWPATRIEDFELVPAAEWEEPRPGIRHTQVQERIAARLRERGLEPVVPESIQNHTENESMLQNTWNSLRSQVYIWVRSCQIDQETRQVRYWQGDQWMVQAPYYDWTITDVRTERLGLLGAYGGLGAVTTCETRRARFGLARSRVLKKK